MSEGREETIMTARASLWIATIVLAITMLGSVSQAQPEDLSLFVAADGNDGNPGTNDKPFATLERARDEIRKFKRDKAPASPTTVNVRAGRYFLEHTFKLSSEDSGTAAATIVYRGYEKDRPSLIGGKAITGFAPYKDQILVADVAKQGLKGIAFRQPFFDGGRQILARYPNYDPQDPCAGGWAYVDGKDADMYRDQPEDSKRLLRFKEQDARTWAKSGEAEVFIFPRFNWWNNIVRIASVDRDHDTMTLAADCSYAIRPGDHYDARG